VKLFDLPRTEEDAVAFLQKKKLCQPNEIAVDRKGFLELEKF
jgi:hypothetical protein